MTEPTNLDRAAESVATALNGPNAALAANAMAAAYFASLACLRRYRDGWTPAAGAEGRPWIWFSEVLESEPMTEGERATLEWLDENEETR